MRSVSLLALWLVVGMLSAGYTYAQAPLHQPAPVYASAKPAYRSEKPKEAAPKSVADSKEEKKKSRKLIGRCWARLMESIREVNMAHRKQQK